MDFRVYRKPSILSHCLDRNMYVLIQTHYQWDSNLLSKYRDGIEKSYWIQMWLTPSYLILSPITGPKCYQKWSKHIIHIAQVYKASQYTDWLEKFSWKLHSPSCIHEVCHSMEKLLSTDINRAKIPIPSLKA